MNMVDISGIDKADLLAAIFNRAGGAAGLGFLQAGDGPETMDRESALKAIGHGDDPTRMFPDISSLRREFYFDYLYGRCLKVNIAGDEMNPDLFDRDHGSGALESVVKQLKEERPA